jgi:hypothetical protein
MFEIQTFWKCILRSNSCIVYSSLAVQQSKASVPVHVQCKQKLHTDRTIYLDVSGKCVMLAVNKSWYVSVHTAMLRYVSVHTAMLGYVSVHIAMLRYVSVHTAMLRYVSVHIDMLRYVSVHTAMLRYVSVHTAMLGYICLFWHWFGRSDKTL